MLSPREGVDMSNIPYRHPAIGQRFEADRHELIGFERSIYKGRKYDALIRSIAGTYGPTCIPRPFVHRLAFGKESDWHYKDTTGLGLFSHMDSYNNSERHKFLTETMFDVSAGYFCDTYLTRRYLYSCDHSIG